MCPYAGMFPRWLTKRKQIARRLLPRPLSRRTIPRLSNQAESEKPAGSRGMAATCLPPITREEQSVRAVKSGRKLPRGSRPRQAVIRRSALQAQGAWMRRDFDAALIRFAPGYVLTMGEAIA